MGQEGAMFHLLPNETIGSGKLPAVLCEHTRECSAPRDEFIATVTPEIG